MSTLPIDPIDEIERLARVLAEQRWDDLPRTVQDQARLVLLDTLGVILLGSTDPAMHALAARLGATGGRGATVLAEGFPAADPRTAALLNGIAGRTPELCEGHRLVSCQAAVQVLPTVLALGEQLGASGPELAIALVVGYEAAVRIGRAAIPHPLAHQNGQWPLLGAIAAGARLHRLGVEQSHRALQAGAVLLLTPSYHATTGATVLNVAGGMSAFAGTLVPELILAGFEPGEHAIQEAFTELVGRGFAPQQLADGLGQTWEITRNHFRLRACCSPIYPALDALEATLADLRPTPEQVERIDVATYAFAAVMSEPDPSNAFAAHYSLPHAAAAIVAWGRADEACFSEGVLHDPAILALRHRVRVREDPALTAMLPWQKPARVTLTLTDGRTSTRRCDNSRGGFDYPYARAELVDKFRDLAGRVLTPAGVAEVQALIEGLNDVAEAGELMDALRRGARTSTTAATDTAEA